MSTIENKSDVFSLDSEYIAHTYARFPIAISHGKGSILYDINGKEYIDLGTGIAVNTFGAADEEWISAVSEQLSKISHTSNLYYTEPGVKLAEMLCVRTGMKRVFFANSGAEANECAIKTARKYAADTKGREYYNIITLKNSFHGRTVTTLAATGQDVFHEDFTPLTEGFLYANANDIDSVKYLAENNKCAAVMLECVQGEGGVMPMTAEFMLGVEKLCREHDMIFVIDEVQTGNGRCGELYAYMNYGVSPDIVTTAKGLAGGLPFGACMFSDKVKDTLSYGQHGSTFGGNPVCAAGAVNVLSRIDDKLLLSVREKSKYIFDFLSDVKGVVSVSGIGFMIGIETEKNAKDIVNKCIERGVLVLTAKTKIRLLPALNISDEQLKKALNIIKEVIEE